MCTVSSAATWVPTDILWKVFRDRSEAWNFFDTKDIAEALLRVELIDYSQYHYLISQFHSLQDRFHRLMYEILLSKGNQKRTLYLFYLCLLKTPIAEELPSELRRNGMH